MRRVIERIAVEWSRRVRPSLLKSEGLKEFYSLSRPKKPRLRCLTHRSPIKRLSVATKNPPPHSSPARGIATRVDAE